MQRWSKLNNSITSDCVISEYSKNTRFKDIATAREIAARLMGTSRPASQRQAPLPATLPLGRLIFPLPLPYIYIYTWTRVWRARAGHSEVRWKPPRLFSESIESLHQPTSGTSSRHGRTRRVYLSAHRFLFYIFFFHTSFGRRKLRGNSVLRAKIESRPSARFFLIGWKTRASPRVIGLQSWPKDKFFSLKVCLSFIFVCERGKFIELSAFWAVYAVNNWAQGF